MVKKLNILVFSAVVLTAFSAFLVYGINKTPEEAGIEMVAFSDLSQADIDIIAAVQQKMVPTE